MGLPGALPQARLGRYELLARLATGGMGEIFLGRLEGAAGFEKLYVVKRILPHLADDVRFRQMLIAEARIASKMSHPNICQVYELGETDGQLYIVMEYLEGVTMLPLLRKASKQQGALDFGFVGGVIQQAGDALHYAHELKDRNGENLGIVHRDVTPSNVFLTESGVTKVLDFGIAKAKGASTNTQEGTVKGKYAYMAPEQLRGAQIDRRVDVFALGVVLYEMLALRRLFQRKTDYLTFRAVMEQPIPDIRRYRPDAPPDLAAALARALDRDPDSRFSTARQFATAVLDSLSTLRRPWSQGELGDFVRATFGDELGKRSQQVATALHRTAAGAQHARSTMPLIAHAGPDDNHEHADDDDGFPSVETASESEATPEPSTPMTATRGSGEFVGGTPPPFSTDTTGSAPKLEPIRPTPNPAAPVAHRSLVWPIFAVAMVVIAGGALFLVWRQMEAQRDQQAPPAQIIIKEDHDRTHDPAPSPGSGSSLAPPSVTDQTLGSGSGGGTAGPKTRPHPVRPQPNPYNVALEPHRPGMVQCLIDHGASGLADVTAEVVIAANGHPTSVTFLPDGLNTTPVGACLRGVLGSVAFPTAAGDRKITIPIKATSKPS